MNGKETTRYFLSANSGDGFYSLFDETISCDSFDKIFVIYGGPGTGKSTLMRRLSERAEKSGAECEHILCSSDPHSLDGVICRKNGKQIAVLDGTPPHPRVISSPALKEELWDVGAFIQAEKLKDKSRRMQELHRQKSEAYLSAYHFLRAAYECHMDALALTRDSLSLSKLSEHIERATRSFSSSGECGKRLIASYGMDGETILKDAFAGAKHKVVICGSKHSAEIYFKALVECLSRKKVGHLPLLSPLSRNLMDGIYLPSESLVYLREGISDTATKKIHMRRFMKTKKGRTARISEAARAERELKSLALQRLRSASEAHFALEEIYKEAVDFSSLAQKGEKWISYALSYLE